MTATTTYQVLRNRPVATFRYRGSHSKPVRRKVVLTKVDRDCLTGYELQEGNTTRSLEAQVIKSYNRGEILSLERFPISALNG